jgi:hypothetical protein
LLSQWARLAARDENANCWTGGSGLRNLGLTA